jgi:TolB-like protein/DNA-binding winged helix-turn-helix (wHTH) protein
MESPTRTMLRVGDWTVNPMSGQISRNGQTSRLEERTMRLLLCLAERPGEVVSIEELLKRVWPDVTVSPDSVYQAVASLRRLLGDDPKEPTYIATVPRLGYRMLANVGPWSDSTIRPDSGGGQPAPASANATLQRHSRIHSVRVVAVALSLVILLVLLFVKKLAHDKPAVFAPAAAPEKSVAVLPFLDLTEGMKEEEFADGVTEELINKLSKIPGLRVPAPTSSFYFKNKRVPVADIAKSLGVTYVVDGSTRKSGSRLRVAARLVRPDNGYVIWSESYDRDWGDILTVQDDIADKVVKALSHSIGAQNGPG